MGQDIINHAEKIKREYSEKRNAELRDRIKYETKDTLSYIERQYAKGKSSKDIARDLEKAGKTQKND